MLCYILRQKGVLDMYNVVFERRDGTRFPASFHGEEEFKVWYHRGRSARYEVVEADVTAERSAELCSTVEATAAATAAIFHGRHF